MVAIPLARPTRLGPEEQSAVVAALEGVVRSDRWVLGDAVRGFEERFAEYLGATHVIGVGNGSDALSIAYVALGLQPGDGVLVPANDGGFAALAARSAGLEPVAFDIDPVTAGPTRDTAATAVGPDVRALVVTHLHGEPVDLAELDTWRRAHGLLLVEDCAQAHGARREGHHVGLIGDAATFSFYPTKNLGAMGDAGAVVVHDEGVADRVRSLREYGWDERYRVAYGRGRNSRLDEAQAAVLTARLPHLDARNQRRREIAARYRRALIGSATTVHGDPGRSVVHHAVLVDDERDALREHLEACGVGTAVHYPYLVGEMPGLGVVPGDVPAAAARRDRILTVPCFPEMTPAEVDGVVTALERWAVRNR